MARRSWPPGPTRPGLLPAAARRAAASRPAGRRGATGGDVHAGGRTARVGGGATLAQLDAATDPLQKSFAGLMLQYAAGDAMDISRMRGMFPIELTSVRDYVSSVLARA